MPDLPTSPGSHPNAGGPLRIGIAGLGKMGLLHAATFNSLPGSRVIAAAEPAALPRGVLAALNPGIRTFPTLEAMLDGIPLDAVVIATPVADHVPAALQCVARRMGFFVEKPLAASAAQGEELVTALRRAPVLHMVGFMSRYIDSFAEAHRILESGCLGPVHRVSGTIYVSQVFRRGRSWRFDRRVAGGGVLLSHGSHLLDLLVWYFGPVRRVNAQTVAVHTSDLDDHAHLMLEFRSGLRGWIDASWSMRDRRTVETTIEVIGAQGALRVWDDAVELRMDEPVGRWPAGTSTVGAAEVYRPVPVDVAGPHYAREDEAFLDALRRGVPAHPDAMEGLHIQRIIEGAYASSREQGTPQEVAG